MQRAVLLGGWAILAAGPDQKAATCRVCVCYWEGCVYFNEVKAIVSLVSIIFNLSRVYVPCSAYTVLYTENNVLILRIIFVATQLQIIIRNNPLSARVRMHTFRLHDAT